MSKPVEILLVEDNANDAELILRGLRKANLANDVRVARDGAEALDFVFSQGGWHAPPRVVILDMNLPKVGGLEVLERLKEDERTKDIPVVMLTSSGEQADVRRAYELGANSYLVKPVDFGDFARVASELGLYWLLLNKTPDPG